MAEDFGIFRGFPEYQILYFCNFFCPYFMTSTLTTIYDLTVRLARGFSMRLMAVKDKRVSNIGEAKNDVWCSEVVASRPQLKALQKVWVQGNKPLPKPRVQPGRKQDTSRLQFKWVMTQSAKIFCVRV
jgi:hypothetical protein